MVQTRWEGPASWRIFQASKTTRQLGRQGPGVYRSQTLLFAGCFQTCCQGGPHQQSDVIIARRVEYTPCPHQGFDLSSHRFQMKCCAAWIVFFRGVHNSQRYSIDLQLFHLAEFLNKSLTMVRSSQQILNHNSFKQSACFCSCVHVAQSSQACFSKLKG